MESQLRQQVLGNQSSGACRLNINGEKNLPENCRWLFNQEVQIITFFSTGTTPGSNLCPQAVYRSHTALVLPKSCSLKSLVESDINEKILIKGEDCVHGNYWSTREAAISNLLDVIEQRIGEILKVDSDKQVQIDKLALPVGYLEPDIVQVEPAKVSFESQTAEEGATEYSESMDKQEKRAKKKKNKRPEGGVRRTSGGDMAEKAGGEKQAKGGGEMAEGALGEVRQQKRGVGLETGVKKQLWKWDREKKREEMAVAKSLEQDKEWEDMKKRREVIEKREEMEMAVAKSLKLGKEEEDMKRAIVKSLQQDKEDEEKKRAGENLRLWGLYHEDGLPSAGYQTPTNQQELPRDTFYSPSTVEASTDTRTGPYMQSLSDSHRVSSSQPHTNIGFPQVGVAEYEQSDLGTVFTPSVSAMSDTTTIPRLATEDHSYLDKIVRDEVNLTLRRVFGNLAEKMTGDYLERS